MKTGSVHQNGLQFFPVWSCENYPLELPDGHPFPNQKYPLLETLLREAGFAENIRRCGTIDTALLEHAHTRNYIKSVLSFALSAEETRRVGFPVGQGYLNRALASVEGTLCATKDILYRGCRISGVLAGGTHHAFADRGEGYCTFNDVAVSARYALKHSLDRVLIVDLDAHQGNGTAAIFAQDPSVFTFSMHAEDNYPRQKERSTFDIGLPSGTDDQRYLSLLKEHLPMILDYFQPQLVFFQSGVDVLAADRFGRLGLSLEGLQQRDAFVFESVLARRLPCVITLGGGYQKDQAAVARAHAQTYLTAAQKLYAHDRLQNNS